MALDQICVRMYLRHGCNWASSGRAHEWHDFGTVCGAVGLLLSHQGPRVAAARSTWTIYMHFTDRTSCARSTSANESAAPISLQSLDNVESRMRCQGTGRLGSHRGGSADRCRLIHRVRAERNTDSGSRRGVRPGTTLKPSFQLSQARYLLTQKGRICATVLV